MMTTTHSLAIAFLFLALAAVAELRCGAATVNANGVVVDETEAFWARSLQDGTSLGGASGESDDERTLVALEGRLVYTVEVTLEPAHVVPSGPKGTRAIIAVAGTIDGPELKGEVVAPSSDWLTMIGTDESDGMTVWEMDIHLVIRTDDDQLLYEHITGRSKRDPDNPDNSVIRTGATFQAPPGKYQYLNNKFLFGHGTKTGNKVRIDYYDTF